MFLQGIDLSGKEVVKFETLTDSGAKIVSKLELLPGEAHTKISEFLERLRFYIDVEGKFYAQGFSLKTKEDVQVISVKGKAFVGRFTAKSEIEFFFFKRDIEDWYRDTVEEDVAYRDALATNLMVEACEDLSTYVEGGFIEWCGLKSQLDIFSQELKSLGVTSVELKTA